MIIALVGKGGVGKSTISSQLVRALSKKEIVLAVDADPNSNLCDKLGIEVTGTIGGLRNEIVAHPDMVPESMSKQEYISLHIRQVMTETDRIDMLVMGRPEGEGCYCFTNDVLKHCFRDLIPKYKYAVIDNEAGMEHLSRRVLPRADIMIFVSDPTMVGVRTAGRLAKLADEVHIESDKRILAINNVSGEISDALRQEALSLGFDKVYVMPHDEFIAKAAMDGNVIDVPSDTPFGRAMEELITDLEP
ncbi:MAG: AAA family ATPase [Candidatus Methanomethylophilaceae archaeon]|nr:AAA family ATPase [Candidatus Methanomethylophilaceae archaeon]